MTSETTSKTTSIQRIDKLHILGSGYVGNYLYWNLPIELDRACLSRTMVDYHDPSTLIKYILNNDVKVIVNCSGYTGEKSIRDAESNKELCWKLNVEVPMSIAKVCEKLGVRIIHIGTGCIFKGKQIFTETDSPNFGLYCDASPFYNKSKHAFEIASEGMPLKNVRINYPYTMHLNDNQSLLYKLMNYPKIKYQVNSKTYLPDLVSFITALMKNNDVDWSKYENYNVVSPYPLSNREICRLLELAGHTTPHWEFEEYNIDLDSYCILDNTEASKIFEIKNEKQTLHNIL